jgi:hypothetical protein
MQSCRDCAKEHPLEQFTKNKRYKSGYDNMCKDCAKAKYHANKEIILAKRAEFIKANPNYMKKYNGKYKENCKKRYIKNKEIIAEKTKEYRKANPLIMKERNKKYREDNRDKVNKYAREWKKEKRTTDKNYLLREITSRRIRYELTTRKIGEKEFRTHEYLGCTFEYFRRYLEVRFEHGMSWDNYGDMWELDHIIPCASWDFTKHFEHLCCWNYRNVRPLWKTENRLKKDKFDDTKKLCYVERMKVILAG